MRRALLVMAKQPQVGKTKTRLCPPLTPELASSLYEAFLQDVVGTCQAVQPQVVGLETGIAYAPSPDAASYFRNVAAGFALLQQHGVDLSERLDGVLRETLAAGQCQVVAINSDSPTLPPSFLIRAFALLDDCANDLVLGPCNDGGYYLIGVNGDFAGTVRNVTMSTPHVLSDTLAEAKGSGLKVALLPAWYDVDDGVGLGRLRTELATLPADVAPATRRTLDQLSTATVDRVWACERGEGQTER